MSKGKAKRKRLVVRILVTIGLTAFVLQLPLLLLNSRTIQRWYFNHYQPFTPWTLSVDSIQIKPWKFQIEAHNITLKHPQGNHISLQSIQARFRPLYLFLKGELVVDPLQINSPHLTLALADSKKEEKKPEKKLKLKTLLLLRSLILKKVPITDLQITWMNGKKLSIDQMDLQLKPTLFKGTQLGIHVAKLHFQNGEKPPLTLENFSLNADTHLNNWSRNFPYVNDINGVLQLDHFAFQSAKVDQVKAAIQYKDHKVLSHDLKLTLKNRKLLGELATDFADESFRLRFNTPETIPLPHFGGTNFPFNFSGDLKADLELEGRGFNPTTSVGKGTLSGNHHFYGETDLPADLTSRFHWEKGIFLLDQGDLKFGKSLITASGDIKLKPLDLNLKFKGAEFPVKVFFERFQDKNLQPISGVTSFDASLTGMGKTIHFQLNGETLDAGYLITHIDKAQAELDVTHDKLLLKGELFTNQNKIGNARLEISFNPKNHIKLFGAIREQPLESTLPDYHLSGTVDAHVEIDSPMDAINGTGYFKIGDGSIFGQSYEKIAGRFSFNKKEFQVDQAELNFPENKGIFNNPLTIEVTPSGFILHSDQIPGLFVDAVYQSDQKKLTFRKIKIVEQQNKELTSEIKGSISPTQVDLGIRGKIGLQRLKFITETIREAEGAAEVDLKISGPLDNLRSTGMVAFKQNTLSLKLHPTAAENIRGTIQFRGNFIETDGLTGELGSGNFKIFGKLNHAANKATSFDIALQGKDIYYRDAGNELRLEYDADLRFQGTQGHPRVSGTMAILDGRYTKNFKVIDELRQAPRATKEIQQAALTDNPMSLDLKIKTLGDFVIDNNIGRIELNTNVTVRGTEFNPRMAGNIEVMAGEIRYLGFNLDITNGFIEFRDTQNIPYLDIEADKELDTAHITARLYGPTSNLLMDLSGTTDRGIPLEKKDVLSLLTTGVTASEKAELDTFSQIQLGPEFVAEQVANVLKRPIERATTLDIVRVEANPTKEGREQRFHFGKRLSDRLEVTFQHALNNENAVQSFALQYWLTDFLLFKGERNTEDQYQMNVGVRFKTR